MESNFFPQRLQQIATARDRSYEVTDTLSSHLHQLALEYKQLTCSAQSVDEYDKMLFIADSAVTSSLVCEQFNLASYTVLAQLSLGFGKNGKEAALWCDRYRKAESDLLTEDESRLGFYARAIRECLNPEKLRQTAEEMRKVLPKDLLDKHCPNFDSSECFTTREMVEQIENLVLEEMCNGRVR